MKKKKGFTLIEIVMVIAVIGILLGLILPRFSGMQQEGNIAKAKAELRTLQAAIESYYGHNNGVYPTTGNFKKSLEAATPNIVKTVPVDPFNASSKAYVYKLSGNKQYYVIYSVGPKGNGKASVANSGTVSETNATSCIYVSNGGNDVSP